MALRLVRCPTEGSKLIQLPFRSQKHLRLCPRALRSPHPRSPMPKVRLLPTFLTPCFHVGALWQLDRSLPGHFGGATRLFASFQNSCHFFRRLMLCPSLPGEDHRCSARRILVGARQAKHGSQSPGEDHRCSAADEEVAAESVTEGHSPLARIIVVLPGTRMGRSRSCYSCHSPLAESDS